MRVCVCVSGDAKRLSNLAFFKNCHPHPHLPSHTSSHIAVPSQIEIQSTPFPMFGSCLITQFELSLQGKLLMSSQSPGVSEEYTTLISALIGLTQIISTTLLAENRIPRSALTRT